jgi:tRNA(Arg) A34 adenosine deaminase TadA
MSDSFEAECRFMQQAIDKAREGIENGQSPFGACIVRDGEVVAVAHNTVWQDSDSTAHAEVNAIREACRHLGTIDLSGCTLYTTCEPCPMCFSACHWAGIERIVFGAGISDAAVAGFSELRISVFQMKAQGGSRMKLVPDFMRSENRLLFHEWLKREDSKPY